MLRIIRLQAERVHGYIPLDIQFDEQLTFLTGSNGSGKTTALRLISAILQPNLDMLDSIEFKMVILEFSIESKRYSIELIRSKDDLNFDRIEYNILLKSKTKKNDNWPSRRRSRCFQIIP